MADHHNESVFNHPGRPTKNQAAELLGYVANAITITIPATGGIGFLLSKTILDGWDWLALIFLVPFGGITILWSWLIVFYAAKGANAGDKTRMAGMLAFGILGFGTSCVVGVILGSILS